jgi:hypothetical protein
MKRLLRAVCLAIILVTFIAYRQWLKTAMAMVLLYVAARGAAGV